MSPADYGRNFYSPEYTTQASSASPSGAVLAALLLGSLVVLGGASHRLYRIVGHALGNMHGVGLLALQKSKLSRPTAFTDIDKLVMGEASVGQPLSSQDLEGSSYIYSGLLNTSTTCYLNSSLQLLASSPSYIAYLRAICRTASAYDDVETPATEALLVLLNKLNTPVRSQSVLQPRQLMDSLLQSGDSRSHISRNRRRILQGSGQQDAQEFFLLLTEVVEEEKAALLRCVEDCGAVADGVANGVAQTSMNASTDTVSTLVSALESPYAASTAHRTSCMNCGYCEAIRHIPSEHLSLSAPNARAVKLENMLAEFSQLELIDEFTCRRCSVIATQIKLQEHLSSARQESLSSSKKKRARETQKHLKIIDAAIDSGDYEQDFPDVASLKIERAIGPASKQAMVAKAPKTGAKNNCQIQFPEYLDMTQYVTSAQLIGDPKRSMAVQRASLVDSEGQPNTYRLQALVVHFGSHSYGHYITYRRRPPSSRSEDANFISNDWFSISDETITYASIQEVLSANPFLLLYERVHPQPRVAYGVAQTCGLLQVQSWQLIDA